MRVNELKTAGFRNLKALDFKADDHINVIFGDNAQGKTNLMEALWLFTGNKSFRGAKESEMIAFGTDNATLKLTFSDARREQTAQLMLGENKKHFLNGVPQKSASDFSGRFFTVVFSPADLSLIKEGPERRRRFLDIAVSQLKPVYGKYLSQYNRVLLQKNALLKDLWRKPSLAETIDLWDLQLAKLGTILTGFRIDYVKKIGSYAEEIYKGISGGSEAVAFEYRSSVFPEEQRCAQTAYTDETILLYAEALKASREEDQKSGSTSVGIHRDDIEVSIDGLSARLYGSQGQQRSCVLALKLAESELLYAVTGEAAVMLLDDVMSELDPKRQDYILNHVDRQQVFITCCDISNTLRLKGGSVFHMENGVLTRISK